jgi:hypothetical protein
MRKTLERMLEKRPPMIMFPDLELVDAEAIRDNAALEAVALDALTTGDT